jgi:hypothetical protein
MTMTSMSKRVSAAAVQLVPRKCAAARGIGQRQDLAQSLRVEHGLGPHELESVGHDLVLLGRLRDPLVGPGLDQDRRIGEMASSVDGRQTATAAPPHGA